MSQSSAANETWTVGRLLEWTRTHFEQKGVESARLCAELLLAKAMGCEKIALYARYNDEPTEDQRNLFRDLVKKAGQHHPIAYLIGEREFYSLSFEVTPDVLIPRPETELIVELALGKCKQTDTEVIRLLDIGTGSGCIAITIAKREPRIEAIATDISSASLEVAQRNADRHRLNGRIRTIQSDIFESIPKDAGPFDLIVSNPPYIGTSERDSLPANVRDYEPEIALFAGNNGLAFYEQFSLGVSSRLRPGGSVFLEIGENQTEPVSTRLIDAAGLVFVGAHCDLAGTERVLEFTRES